MRQMREIGIRLALPLILLAGITLTGRRAAAIDAPPDGLFTAEEAGIHEALKAEFSRMGPRAHILRGTRLFINNPHRSKYYNVNALGFRGSAPERKKKNGYNIMVMGGSTVFGDTTKADHQTIPALLESHLKERYPERSMTVYNLGVPGYEFQREVDFAKRLWKRLDPDLVIFYNGGNNLALAYSHGYSPIRPFNKEDETLLTKKRMTYESFYRQLLWLRIRMPGAVRRMLPNREQQLRDHRAEFVQGYLHEAAEIDAYFRKRGIPVLFILQPVLEVRTNKTLRERSLSKFPESEIAMHADFYANFLKELKAANESKAMQIHDFSDAFDGYDGEIYFDLIHVSLAGNKIIAQKMFDLIEELSLVAGKK